MNIGQRQGILCAGNWLVDYIKIIDTWPAQETLANTISESRAGGGSPFNVLIALARLGADFPLQGAGLIGDDEPGEWILQTCRGFDIDVSFMRQTKEAKTSYTDVMTVQKTGRRTFFHYRGTNALLDEDLIDLERSHARHFHLGYLLLLDRLDQPGTRSGTKAADLLLRASELGFITSADTVSEKSDRFSRLVLPALPFLDIAFFNEYEAACVAGVQIRDGDRIDAQMLIEAADSLLKAGVRRWVIIHFPEGILAAASDGAKLFQPSLNMPASQIIGTVGAGDAAAAGILFGYHAEMPIERCLLYGVCTAAASLRAANGTDGVATLDECLNLKKEFGEREPIL
ncbi:MAG: carbohydrate kinase family protein [Verrucomicrobia bacterium]|nr:carbohydrate kinase family protein [Verrucomicrobiota bacterium]MBV9671204.1 carbohydrate kinase family protein [Verrucomicrobiota bacterium]